MVELPDLAAEPAFKLPRDSAPLSERLSEPLSEPLSEFWFDRCNPPFEEPFPMRELSRLFATDLLFDAAPAPPRAEKKC